MENYKAEVGDIILVDSQKSGAKLVKFFMQSPTVWHHLYRMITKTLIPVPYYHVRMIHSVNWNEQPFICEQAGSVRIKEFNPSSPQMIFRKKKLTKEQKGNLFVRMRSDLGKGYDVLNCLGKFFTWLTGIKQFGRYMQWPGAEICVNRVAYWMKKETGETFGAVTHSEVTTQSMYEYLVGHPDQYEVVYVHE